MAVDTLGPVATKVDQATSNARDAIGKGAMAIANAPNLIADGFNKLAKGINDFIGNTDHSATNSEGQQHDGDNVQVYGEGSQYGSEIPGDTPDPNGANESVDIDGVSFPGKGNQSGYLKSYYGASSVISITNNLMKAVDKTQSAVKELSSGIAKSDSFVYRKYERGMTIELYVPRKKKQ